MHQEEDSPSCHMGQIHALFFVLYALYHCYLLLYLVLHKSGAVSSLHKTCQAAPPPQGISEHTNQEHQGLIHQSPICSLPWCQLLQPAHRDRSHWLRQPSHTQFSFELIAQSIESCCNGWALFLPHVIAYSYINTNLQNNWYNSNMYNGYKRYNVYITITLSAWVSFLKPKFQKMSSIRWKRPLLIAEIFLTTVPLAEYLQRKMQEVKRHTFQSNRPRRPRRPRPERRMRRGRLTLRGRQTRQEGLRRSRDVSHVLGLLLLQLHRHHRSH